MTSKIDFKEQTKHVLAITHPEIRKILGEDGVRRNIELTLRELAERARQEGGWRIFQRLKKLLFDVPND